MNLEQAITALHGTKLPRLRQRQLVVEAAHAPSDAARALMVARARHEAQKATEEHTAAIKADLLARWQNAQDRAGYEPPPVTPKLRPREFPEERPVTISWTTPAKPDIVRPPRRAEVIGANRKPRTKPVPPKIPQVVDVAKPEPAVPKRGYGDKPPVNLPEGKVHGSQAYKDYKCRCHICREGKRLNRTGQGLKAPRGTIPQHGTTTGYTKLKCRDGCPGHPVTGKTCREAMTEWARERRAEKKAQADGY